MARARRRRLGRRLADRAEMAAVRLLFALCAPVGPQRLSSLFARAGRFALPRLPFLRRRVAENLALARPEADAQRLSAGLGAHFARLIAEYMRLDALAAEPERLEIRGAARLEGPLAEGRGAVIASAHFGNWEAVRLAVRATAGRDCALIYRPFNNPRFDAFALRRIARAGEPVLHKGRAGTRALLRHVAGGGVAMVLVDQRQTGAPLIPFLGREAETATAAADLALRFGAALIPARARRLPGGRFEVTFEPEASSAGGAEAMMAEVNARISGWIEADPEQWFWLHRRWRLRLRGAGMRAARGR